jgi:hypothetical protein
MLEHIDGEEEEDEEGEGEDEESQTIDQGDSSKQQQDLEVVEVNYDPTSI